MTTFTSVFGNNTVPPSQYEFRAFNLTADTTLAWPDNTDGTDLVASLMNVTPSGGVWNLTLPAANEVSTGRDFIIRNLGAVDMNVLDNAGGALVTIAAGESRYFYVTGNATAAGTWSVFTYGTGTSSADAAALAGYGLTVDSGVLSVDAPIEQLGSSHTILETNRAQFLVYQGGTGTWYLPTASSLTNGFFCYINNAGSGTLTLDASTAGGTLDESNSKTIQPGESLMVVSEGGLAWYSVGYGRSSTFTFTQLSVDVTAGGAITITSAQAANKLWYFYNMAASDVTVTIPAVASVYFVRVGSVGAGIDVTITTGSGATVTLTANQSYTIYCDGTNVVSAQTVAVTSIVSLDDGSAGSPSLNFTLDSDTGFYRSAPNVLGIAVGGSMAATFGASGMTLNAPLAVAQGGTGVTTSTGTGAVVRATSPTLVTPNLGTPSALVGTNITGTATGLTAGGLVGVSAAQVAIVAGIDTEVVTVAGIAADVTAVAADAVDIGTVATNIADVNTVAGISADVITVAGVSADVTTVATNIADVTAVAADAVDIGAVATDIANVNTVAANIADVGAVAAIDADVSTVAGISADVSAVAGVAPDVSAVAAQFIGWNFSTTTTMADPGSGVMRFNNATLASVTAIAFDDLNSAGADVSAYVLTWDDSSSTTKGTLTIRQGTANFALFDVTGLTDNAGWTQVAVTHVASSGTFIDATLTFVDFDRTGDAGTGDVNGPGSSVDGEIVLFDGTGGKTIKRATTTGVLKATSGVIAAATAGTDYVAPGTATNFTKPQRPSLQAETAPSSNTITWDLTDDQVFQCNLNANITTFNLTGTLSSLLGNQYQFIVRYNGGTTITWNSNFKWPAATAPTLTGTSGKIDIFNFVVGSTDGGTTCYLFNTGKSQNMGA